MDPSNQPELSRLKWSQCKYPYESSKCILEVVKRLPEPLIFVPLTAAERKGTVGVGTANPWKLSDVGCGKKKKDFHEILHQSLRTEDINLWTWERFLVFILRVNKPVLRYCTAWKQVSALLHLDTMWKGYFFFNASVLHFSLTRST